MPRMTGEGSGGGLTNPSRQATGGYGGVRGAPERQVKSNALTGDSRYYAHKNGLPQNTATQSSTNAFATQQTESPDLKGIEEDIINKSYDDLEGQRDSAQLALQERAAAMGFGGGGNLAAAQTALDSDYATKKAGAARDTRIAFGQKAYDDAREERLINEARSYEESKETDGAMSELKKAADLAKQIKGSGKGGAPSKGGGNQAKISIIGGGQGGRQTRQVGGGGGAGAIGGAMGGAAAGVS